MCVGVAGLVWVCVYVCRATVHLCKLVPQQYLRFGRCFMVLPTSALVSRGTDFPFWADIPRFAFRFWQPPPHFRQAFVVLGDLRAGLAGKYFVQEGIFELEQPATWRWPGDSDDVPLDLLGDISNSFLSLNFQIRPIPSPLENQA